MLVGGGSGIVPLMAMLRHRRRTGAPTDMRLLYSVRTPEDVFYAGELGDETTVTYTREAPPGWTGATGHISAELVQRTCAAAQSAYVCGSNAFVETATQLLMAEGLAPTAIRTERYN